MKPAEIARREAADALLDAARKDPAHPLHLNAVKCAEDLATDFSTPARVIMAGWGFR